MKGPGFSKKPGFIFFSIEMAAALAGFALFGRYLGMRP